MSEAVEIHLRVNGETVTRRVAARQSLVDFLREELGLTGTRAGCEHGVCGACTVRLDGAIVRSCLLFAAQDLLLHEAEPDRERIREHLSGNYCRCTGYQAIVDAVESTARARTGRNA